MDSNSSFTLTPDFSDATPLHVGGSTCDCYRVRLYGKLHFLKRLKPHLRTDPRYVALLQKEFETGYLLDHPNIVRYVSRTPDGLLMDYVDGETLKEFADHHPDYFSRQSNTDRILRQILDAVGYLHHHQIVHLDLKPANIMITRVGHDVKLIDLGYCYTDTYSDTMGRTDKYAAPEQRDGSTSVDARTDIYALGRLLQTLPCAHRYDRVIKRCTANNPALRYQSIAEMEKAILPRRRYAMTAAIILFCIALTALLFWWNPFQKTDAPAVEETVTEDTAGIAPSMPSDDSSPSPEAPSPSPEVHPSEKPSAVSATSAEQPVQPVALQPATPQPVTSQQGSSAIPTKGNTAADAAEIHQLMLSAISPIYDKYLRRYRDLEYHNLTSDEQSEYARQHVAFESAVNEKFRELWQKNQHRYSQDLFSAEFEKVREYYDSQSFLPSRVKK